MKTAILIVLALSKPAFAEGDAARTAAAARAFQEGQKAQLMGRHQEAAEKYELADEILPTEEALRSALRARLAANDVAIAATHAETLLARCGDDACRAYPSSVLEKLRSEVAPVKLTCSEACTVAIDGRPVITKAALNHRFFVRVGSASVEAIFSDGTTSLAAEATAGVELALNAQAPVRETPPPEAPVAVAPPPAAAPALVATAPVPEASSGLHPVVPLIGFGAAVALGAAAGWSIADASSAHDAYVSMPTADGWDDGRSRDLRSNILLYSAVGTAALSTLVAILWTDW